MGSLVLYAAAVALVGGLGMALTIALSGRGQASGVARSLALIEHKVSRHEVAKNDLPAVERLVKPLSEGMRALAVRLSPSGTGERLIRQLDAAGNPHPWTVQSILAAKGASLVTGRVLGLPVGGGFSAKALPRPLPARPPAGGPGPGSRPHRPPLRPPWPAHPGSQRAARLPQPV